MFPIHWLYRQFVGDIPTGHARCYLCGMACPEAKPVAKGVPDTFNSHYLARAPSSPWLCAACAWYLDNRLEHPAFRKMSLIVSRDSWQNWQRDTMKADIARWLAHGLEQDAYLVVSLSKKKHILLQAGLTTSGARRLIIQVEEQPCYVYPTEWERMDAAFTGLLALGHNKGEILSGSLYAQTLRKHGQIADALVLSNQVGPYRKSTLLELLSYVTIIDKEESHESTSSGDGSNPSGIAAPESRVESDRPGVQSPLQDGHLAAGRKQRGSVRADEQHAQQVSQQSLF